MSRAKKVDANQGEIVTLFRELGAKVAITSSAGGGFPDLVVQVPWNNLGTQRVVTYLVEIKDGSLSKSRRALTPCQKVFHSIFSCHIVECRADVFELMGMNDPDGSDAE